MSESPLVDASSFPGLDLATKALPHEVAAIRTSISAAMKTEDPQRPGKTIGSAKTGIYLFWDFDGEPIYTGQTAESFSTRVGRHLTGQRSDAVAKYVLDPFEVYAITMWSIPQVALADKKSGRKKLLDAYEWTVYRRALKESQFQAVLNEGNIQPVEERELPESVSAVIIPNEIFPDRAHPDVRIARRALTVSLLAKNISERKVSVGLRRTLVTQSRRLRELSERRFEALGGELAVGLVDGDVDVADG